MRFLFACGGSAGHINPALAIAGALRSVMPDCEILFVGSGRKLENRLIPNAGYELVHLKLNGLERGLSPGKLMKNVSAAAKLLAAGRQAGKLLRERRPDAVVGTGGYVCYPALKKAAKMRIPTFLHESNAIPGLTVKLLSGRVTNVFASFPGTEERYADPKRVVITGTPVRPGFGTVSGEDARRALGLDDRPLVLSYWGSLGAARMNAVIADFIRCNAASGEFRHIHATGGYDAGLREQLGETEKRLPSWIDIRPYIDDMPRVMAASDLALSRAGASTVAELALTATPAVLIPSPFVPNNHQTENAAQAQKNGGAVMLSEAECTGESLYNTVLSLLGDRERLRRMSEAQKKLASPGAADRIAERILAAC
ncbi:MAG: UDP-N-acetylglucosamine--N-acetylmuramyl-(pentapeptide) pyrophosphoryl-undecaprenol N-acetylglucosamine transferase [Oscillospiraceae bacterium]|jgi:UDP-N-acetylglucosamine--N-acetylmuramyl-(pentapeptide) pyrophosphoryl-undecaprenol N-acetylglucosamine transferase|nr:UDP-N-acetylglucosamine--N-acetylmuramyl-(pentapeptide) pyrophosphoryl-undecaprenol N-acetylglucosamine transferase [Oscillospiraceae bacterium]